ncbi:lytic transglycosylase domain-containing protein [Desulfovibrio piger]|uniref:lytic transglycosylase domain-containing protein n=1 Tax=Desulfovibrio piger TaxID=901 RepID=UPI0039F4B060
MFDWYTTMNQPDWDGRTYALPLPSMMPPSQQNPMQRPQATNEMLPQGSVSGGLLGKLAEEGEQATPRMPSPFGAKQGQGGTAASPAPSPAPMQRPAPQANPLTAPVSGPLAGPVMQPQMMPQQPLPMAVPYGWGQPLPQMAGQGTASAQAGKTGEDKGFLGNLDPGALALFAGLSMLGNNTGGRTFGQLVGKAGFDALAGAGGMAAAQAAAERQKKQDAREDMTTRIAQHKIDLERYKMAQEAAGMQLLQGYLGGGAGGGMGGMMPSRPTLGGAYTGAALAPEVDGWIVKYSQEYGVDPNIVRAVVMQESGGRQDVVSPAGAIGYGQLMPDTAKGLGVDPYDPEQNIKGTVMYLGQMRDRYDGNWDRALYAYNWGPGNMDAYLKTGKGLDGRPMPSETLNYVPGVRGRLGGGQQPAVAGGYGGGGVPTIPLQALALPGAAGEAARAIFAAQQKAMDRLQYVDGVGMIDKSTGMVAPLRTADGMPYMSPKQRKEEADAAKQEQARDAQRRFALQNAKTQMTSLDNALSMIPEPGRGVSWDTGLTGSVLSMLPGTDARNLQAELDTIGSGSMLQTMQALKAASPTGATGMGALSDSEGKLLRESLGSLDTWQSPEQLRRNLLNIKKVYTDMLVSWGYTPEQAASLFAQPKRGGTPAGNGGVPELPPGFREVM